jgi:hypothetical protein
VNAGSITDAPTIEIGTRCKRIYRNPHRVGSALNCTKPTAPSPCLGGLLERACGTDGKEIGRCGRLLMREVPRQASWQDRAMRPTITGFLETDDDAVVGAAIEGTE